MLGDIESVYRWQGKIQTENEVTVLIKTHMGLYDQVEAAITATHPYELPEVIAFPVTRGLPAYLKWVAAETSPQ